jgi:hypothetical protein
MSGKYTEFDRLTTKPKYGEWQEIASMATLNV